MTSITGGAAPLGAGDRHAIAAATKQLLRVTSDDEAALIETLAESALGLAEQFLGQLLIEREIVLVLPAQSGWQRLSVNPVRAITGVAGLATDGSVTALPLVGYDIDIDAGGDGWVRIVDSGGASRLQVVCAAGLAGDWAALPPPIRQGIVLLAGYLFGSREAGLPPPGAITALWRPFRRFGLDRARHA